MREIPKFCVDAPIVNVHIGSLAGVSVIVILHDLMKGNQKTEVWEERE